MKKYTIHADGVSTPDGSRRADGTTGIGDVIKTPWWKRGFDLTLIAVGLPLSLPVMALMAATIKLVSPGPVLYVQRRIGHGRRPFSCLKFRTMHVNTVADPHLDHLPALIAQGLPLKKVDQNEARVIPLGRWIRASGLDELPQLWNIARGEMSFVGPRPCTDYELACYRESELPRFKAIPGLTGLWQVSGKNDTTFTEMIQYDLQYIQKCSLTFDIEILARTPVTVLRQLFRIKPSPHRKFVRAARTSAESTSPAMIPNQSSGRTKPA